MPILAMRCQAVSLQERPWCTSFRRPVNKHSEEYSKFIWLTFGICKVGLKFLEYETFESYTLCHHQELARGALKQCRETWASSLPFLSTPPSRSAAALARPLLCEEQPGSLPPSWPCLTWDHFAAGWHGLLWLKPPGELIVPYNCQEWV